jgi:putative ABC transport system permease protein
MAESVREVLERHSVAIACSPSGSQVAGKKMPEIRNSGSAISPATGVLAVFERTRELGMLRPVRMTRRQVRRMIRHESTIPLIGAGLGLPVGLFIAAMVTRALFDQGLTFALPVTSLVAFVIVAIMAGLAAAILPARRAARLHLLHALQYE